MGAKKTRRKTSARTKEPGEHSRQIRKKRRVTLLAVAILVTLGASAGLATLGGLPPFASPEPAVPTPEPLGLQAGAPAKEFIYAGGRLLATEEPAGASCNYSISPTSASFPSSGGTGGVNVSAGTGCAWQATNNNPEFITITSGSSGSGAGTVNYSVAANAGGARGGTLTIAGHTFAITQSGAGTNNAAFVSQSVAASMTAGSSQTVSVTMWNTGTTTWTTDTYKLGSQNPENNTNWGLNRVPLAAPVAPDAQVTFVFSITAPSTPATYNFQWRMIQEGVGFFGASSTNVAISVTGGGTNGATFVSQSVATSMTTGQNHAVSITMRNSGTTTWTTDTYRLGSQNPQDNMTWGLNRVSLPVSVAPNEEITFDFNVTAPSTAGTYEFQWRMVQEGVGFFGASSTNVSISVSGGGGGGPLDAPGNLTAVPVSASAIALAWTDNSTQEDGFRVERQVGIGPFKLIATLGANTTGYTDTGLSPGTYTYRVNAFQGNSTSAYSNEAAATLGGSAPAAPSNLTATADPGPLINLSWTRNSTNEEGFRIERKTGTGGFTLLTTVGAGITFFADENVAPLTTYTYRVKAYNGSLESDYSNEAGATTGPASPPAAPSDLTATAADSSQINLAWLDNSNDEDGFKIERKTGSGSFQQIATAPPNATGYSDGTVSASTTYTYRVRAYNAGGDSSPSNEASATTPGAPTPPAAPGGLTAAAASSSQINLAWVDNSDNEEGFKIERSVSGGSFTEIATVGANVTGYSNTGLTASTTYTYRVRAFAGTHFSEYSNQASATTPAGGTCPTVSVFSGSGVAGYAEGSGTSAQWRSPNWGVVARDPGAGNHQSLFIADTENHRIRMIHLEGPGAGSSVLIAGDGTAGYSDGNGKALNARYNHPRALTAVTNASGVVTYLLIADTENNTIRRLNPPSGSGQWAPAPFSGPAPPSGTAGFKDGTAGLARYWAPQGIVAASDGNVYVADTGNAAIRKLTSAGDCSTLVGTGTFSSPVGITASTGTTPLLYVSDVSNHRVRRVTTGGQVTVLAGSGSAGFADGTGTAALFNAPSQLIWANTAEGAVLYVSDRENNRLRKIVISSAQVSTHAGSGTAGFLDGSCTTARFNRPRGVSVGPGGEVFVIDTVNNRIRKAQ